MADAYKGLTIRIGAETTGLTQALKSANSTITKTKGELSKLKTALRFDPSSAAAMTTQMQALAEKGTATANKINILKDAARALYTELTGKELSPEMTELANETKEAATNASDAKARYNALIETVASVKNAIEKLSGIDDFWEQSKQDIDANLDRMSALGGETEELVTRYRKLSGQVSATQAELEKMNKVEQLGNLRTDIIRTEAELKNIATEYVKVQAKQALAFSGSNVGEYRSQIKQLGSATDSLSAEFRELQQAAELDPENINVARAAVRNLHDQSDLTADKIKLLRKELSEVENASGVKLTAQNMQNIAKQTMTAREEAVKWQTKLQTIKSEISSVDKLIESTNRTTSETVGKHTELVTRARQLRTELTGVQAKADAAMKELEAKEALSYQKQLTEQITLEQAHLSGLQNELNTTKAGWLSMLSSLTSVGMTAYATITPLASNFIRSAIEDAQTFDAAYRDMRKTVEGTEEQFEELRDAAVEFANTHVTSADQILEIEAMGGQLGIAVDDLKEFANTVSNLDIATNIDADTLAEELGQLSSIMDFTSDEYDNFADSLVRLGNNEPALESAIMDITSRIGSQASILGMSADQVLAYSTALAATGQNSEAAGTALSKTMAQIETAVSSGGDALNGFAELSGMSAEEFAKAWEDDAAGAMQLFIEGLKRVDDSGGSVDATLQDLGITAVRQKQALEGLSQTTDVLDDALVMSADAWNGVSDQWGAAGDAAREAQKKSEGFSGTLGSLQNVCSNISSEIADGLTPVLGLLRDGLQAVYDATSGLTDSQKTLVVGLIGAAAATGPVLTAFGSVGAAIDRMRDSSNVAKGTFAQAVKEMVSGSKSVKSTVAKTADVVEDSGEAWVNLGDSMDTTNRKAATLEKGMKALKGASVLVATVIATMAISALADYIDRQNKAQQATQGLADSVTQITGEFKSEAASASASSTSLDDYKNSVRALTDSQAELASTIANSYTEASANISMLDQARGTIEQYAGSTNLTTKQVGELTAAIDLVNEQLGTSYSVVASGNAYDVLDGDAKKANDSILELIDTQEKQMKLNALQESYTSAYEQYYKNVEAYEEGLQKVHDIENKIAQVNKEIAKQGFANPTQQNQLIEYQSELDNLNGTLDEAKTNLDSSESAVSRLSDRYAALSVDTSTANGQLLSYIANNETAWSAMEHSNGSATSLADSLASVGIKEQDLANVDWSVLQANFDGTFASISSDLTQMGVKFDQSKADALNHQQGLSMAFAKIASSSDLATSQTISNVSKSVGGVQGLASAFAAAGVSVEDLANLTDDQLSKIVSDYATSGTDIKSAVESAASTVTASTPTIGKAIPEGLLLGMKTYSGQASEYMKSESQTVIDAVRSTLGINSPSTVMMQLGQFTTQGFVEGMTQNQGAISTAFNSAIADLASSAILNTATFNTLGSNVMTQLGNGITNAASIPRSALNSALSSVAKAASNSSFSSALNGTGSKMMTSLSSGITSNASRPRAAAQSAANNTVNAIKTTPNNFKTIGVQTMNMFANGINSAKGQPKTAANNAVNDAKDSAKSKANNFSEVGRQAMSGFAKGIRDNAYIATAAAAAAARDAKRAADAAIKVGSPSKEFAKTGMWAMRGFAVGFEDEEQNTAKTIKASMMRIVDATQSYLDSVELTFSPELATDLSSEYAPNVTLNNDAADAGAPVYNIYLNDIVVNDDEEIQDQAYSLIQTLLRKGGM